MPSLFYAGQPDYIEKLNTLATAASMTNGTVAASFLSLAVTGTATAASFVGPLTGNASTATTLATARNINGVSFNGSADITVAAAAGTLTGTTLAANVVNASISSITPAGGTLAVASGDLKLDDSRTAYWGAGSTYILGSSGSGFLRFYTGSSLRGGFDSAGLSVTGSISATGSIGVSNVGGTAEYPIDVIRADASAVSLRIRNVSASANAYSMVGVNASGNSWGMRMGSAAANSNALEWVLDAFSSPVVKMSLTTAGNLSVTGAINATGTIASSNALETLNSGSLYQYNAGSTTFFRSRNNGNNLDVSYNGGGVITRTNTSGFAVTGLTTTDTLRVNVTPTAETPTATHTAVFNINGTNYKFLCLVA